jgi:NAD(P)-dependent dehydrogenase (short-subunit alcohol dehydrogenase family)
MSVFKDNLFRGKVALVTGGGTGIGRAIAFELASLGAHVVISGRKLAALERTRDEINRAFRSGVEYSNCTGRCSLIQFNIRDEQAVDDAVASIVKDNGRIDYLVNNAGGQFAAPAAAMSAKGWKAVVDTNLNGTFLVTQAVYKHAFSEQNSGSIVSIVADNWQGFPVRYNSTVP